MARIPKEQAERLEAKRTPKLPRKLKTPKINGATKGLWSKIDSQQQERLVEMLLANGMRAYTQFHDAIEKQLGYKISTNRLKTLIDRVNTRWAIEDADAIHRSRSAATRRGYQNLAKAHRKEDLGTVVKVEHMINQIEGNYAPIKFEMRVEVTQALMATIGNLTLEQINDLLIRNQETKLLAEKARHAGLTIDAEYVVKQ